MPHTNPSPIKSSHDMPRFVALQGFMYWARSKALGFEQFFWLMLPSICSTNWML